MSAHRKKPGSTLVDLVSSYEGQPQELGLYIYENGTQHPSYYPYAAMHKEIASFAHQLHNQGVRKGTKIILPFETSSTAIFAFQALILLGALPLSVKPWTLNIPKKSYQEFIGEIVKKYGAEFILLPDPMKNLTLSVPALAVPTLQLEVSEPISPHIPKVSDIAFVQFSSGSTAFPKGVPISHENLMRHLQMITDFDKRVPGEPVASWLPLFHDMGLIGGLLSCFHSKTILHLQPPQLFLMEPLSWLTLVSEKKIIGFPTPNFAIDYSLKFLESEADLASYKWDFNSLRHVYLGSEPINISNLDRFLELLSPYGLKPDSIRPCYGMAEAVLIIAGCQGLPKRTVSPSGLPSISVGQPLPEFDLQIRGTNNELLPEGKVGEIAVRGGTLSTHYYNDEISSLDVQGFFATGDLGFIQDGELFITGRCNDRIKINAASYFSHDFEQVIETLPFVRTGRVAVLESEGNIHAIVEVQKAEVLRNPDLFKKEIIKAAWSQLGVKIPAENILFARIGSIQKTSSGKLQRSQMANRLKAGKIKPATLLNHYLDKGKRLAQKKLITRNIIRAG